MGIASQLVGVIAQRPAKMALGGAIFARMTMLLYAQMQHDIDESSFFVKQTLFNISQGVPGLPIPKVCSRIRGIMLQRKGIADVAFSVSNGTNQTARVSATAHREKLDWHTDKLVIEYDGKVYTLF